jgi:glycosyltransferase involved in cell wall biosynthesis
VREHCGGDSAIINAGFLTPPEVQELLTHAGIFTLPSSHEGLPISLLEAMRLGTPIVASNIPANLETGLDEGCYFPVGDTDTLSQRVRELAAASPGERAIAYSGPNAQYPVMRSK